jgi:hypothetical protein
VFLKRNQQLYFQKNGHFIGLTANATYDVNGKSLCSVQPATSKKATSRVLYREVGLATFECSRRGAEMTGLSGKKVSLRITEPVDVGKLTEACKPVMGEVVLVDKDGCAITNTEESQSKL